MTRLYATVIFLLLALRLTLGQILLVPYDSVTVTHEGTEWQNAWAGGFNSPQFSEIDLDGDGRKDLVAFERNFYGSFKTFLNKGGAGEALYVHDPGYPSYFPPMRNWMLLRDYNCDGKEDIFTSVPAGIAVYRNDSEPGKSLQFTLVTPLLQTFGLEGQAPLYVSPPDIPSITDVDEDGDLDILTFNVTGSTLEYHKNLSMENNGNCEELVFELRNACWGFFSEDGNNNSVNLYDTCENNVSDPEKSGRHAGSTVLAIDITGNGVKDLLLGDITYPNLVMLQNGGTVNSSVMIAFEAGFPSNSVPVELTVFPAAYHLDVDNDGLKDLLVAPNNPNTSENYDNTWYYRNEGSAQLPSFTFQQDDFIHEQMIDLGERSHAVFFDENGDGLMDIIVGGVGYFISAGVYDSRLMLLRNTGSETKPAFDLITDDYAGLSVYDFDGIYPSFGDLDSDGDLDMVTGDENGSLHYFRNDGGTGNPAQFALAGPNYMGIDAGRSAKPQVVDVDGDGLADLLVGERSGTIRYYHNDGSPAEAFFNSVPTEEEFGNIDVMPECCTGFAAPFMVKDSLGNNVLYVGSEQGYLYRYPFIEEGTEVSGLVDSLYLNGVNVNVSGTDINGDGHMEFVYGQYAGGAGLLRYGIPPNTGIDEGHVPTAIIDIYPNPASTAITLSIQGKMNFSVHMVTILDIHGQVLLEEQMPDGTPLELNVGHLSPGIYILLLRSADQFHAAKFVKR